MGSSSRTERCERFIAEFNDDYIKACGIKSVNKTVIAEALGFHDLYECVFHYVTILAVSAVSAVSVDEELMFPDVIYDPDGDEDTVNACIHWLAETLEKDVNEIEARFRKVGLL